MTALLAADGQIVPGEEAGEIRGIHHRAARDVAEIAGQLRPESSLGVQILAHADHAEAVQGGDGVADAAAHAFELIAQHQDRQMAVAECDGIVGEPVGGGRQTRSGRLRRIVRLGGLPGVAGHPRLRGASVHGLEGLRQDQFMRHAQKSVQQAGAGCCRIFLDGDHCSVASASIGRPEFQGIASEEDAMRGQIRVERRAGYGDGAMPPSVQQA